MTHPYSGTGRTIVTNDFHSCVRPCNLVATGHRYSTSDEGEQHEGYGLNGYGQHHS